MCKCSVPRPRIHGPSGIFSCLSCGREVAGPWVLNGERITDFFEYLELFPTPVGTESPLAAVRGLCRARELAGRVKFGFAYLDRDNAAEALEEAADGINYCLMEQLRYERAGGDEHAKADLYEAAHYFALAYGALQHARARRRGAP